MWVLYKEADGFYMQLDTK